MCPQPVLAELTQTLRRTRYESVTPLPVSVGPSISYDLEHAVSFLWPRTRKAALSFFSDS